MEIKQSKKRKYTYLSRTVSELYRVGLLCKCDITTLHYDGSTESDQMWMKKRQFEAALNGDEEMRWAIEATITESRLYKVGRI